MHESAVDAHESAVATRAAIGIRSHVHLREPRWWAHADRFGLLSRLAERLDRTAGLHACWTFLGAHSRGAKREVAYPNLRLGPKGYGPIRVNRLVLLLEEVPQRVLARGTDADLLLYILRGNRAHARHDSAHQCDARGLGAACVNPAHLAWEPHADNVRSGVARKRQRDAERRAQEYLAGVRC